MRQMLPGPSAQRLSIWLLTKSPPLLEREILPEGPDVSDVTMRLDAAHLLAL